MKRIIINELEKIVSEDLNDLQKSTMVSLFDKTLRNLFKSEDGFLGHSFKPQYIDSGNIQLLAGTGFIYDGTKTGFDPKYRAINSDDPIPLSVGVVGWPNASSGMKRWDLVVVRSKEEVTEQSNREIKTVETDEINDVIVDKISEFTFEHQIVLGEEDPTDPDVPAVPAGWISVCRALVGDAGIATAKDLKDVRNVLQSSRKVNLAYDAIVGSADECTHATLADALKDPDLPDGSHIFITESEEVAETIVVDKNDVKIEFKSGVTFADDGAGTGISIEASGVRILGGRFEGFTTAISIADGANHNFITENRFSGCTTDVEELDSAPNNVIFNSITE